MTVSITENDADGVTISPTTLTVAEGDASGASYTVVLTSQPAGDVTITISGHSGTDLSISGTTLSGDDELTFTTENWGTAQTVTVKAAEDDDAVTDADVTLAHAISSTDDSAYDALANQSVTVSITENDADGVTIAPTTLTVAEGDASGASYTVVLTSQPAGDVTIAISGHSGTDLSISGTTLSGDDELTFTTENWGTAQTVTVKAAEDDDAVTDADVTLVHEISSADDSVYDALANQSVTVSITENDADGVTISPTTLTVAEGDASGASYTVVLTSQPAGDVTITISGHSGTDLSISGTTLSGDDDLTFTTENWGTAQTVKVEAAEDGDAVTDADVTLVHEISSADDSAYDALANQSVTVSITENDADGVTISPTTLTVAEGDASGASYTVVLTSQPAGDVTITISGHSGTDLSISGTTLSGDDELTFTTENWGTAQTVTVKAAEDGDATTDPDVTLVHEISSADDSAYDALANQSVTVSITENDADGVTIAPTTLTVAEGDASGASYTVVLTSQPAGDVTITISGHSGTDLSISGTTLSGDDELTFTTENWGTAQTVKVEAAEDGDATTDPDVTLVHEISSADDSAYDALANQSVTVSITENDADGVTIAPTTLTVAEGDASGASYTVVLTSQPAGDVTITISGHSGTDLSISGTTLSGDDELTFTTENWGTAQTVTVKAAEDDDAVTDADVTLAHAISSTDDSVYNALANQSVTVSITENDADGVTISPTTLTVAEGDASGASYTVVLTSQPAGDVTITISGHSGTDLSISGTTLSGDDDLTFTTENWGTAQTVKVEAAEDGDAVTDADVTLAHAISSTDDSVYNALANQSVTVSITENDADGVTISPTTLTVAEGDASGASYTVVLTSQPAGDVTITISGHSGTDLSISGTTLSGDDELTFTTENWGTAQTVKVEAAEDGDATTDPDVTLAHEISSADDSAYDALANQSVTVSITENDADGVTIAPTTLTVAEGDASGASYTVVLTSQPAGDVTITISGHSGTDLSISGTTLSGDDELTFTTENWGTAQTVKVEAAEDGDATTDPDVTLVHEISSADDSAYDALANQSVTVSITENDADGVTIAPTTLTVAEGDASGASYTVVLTSQPAGDVTITISGHSGTDLSISGTTLSGDDELTFTTENWGTAQTVTVKAAEDGDATTDPDVTLVHEISSADDSAYDALANQSVTVSITENDADGVTIAPTTLTVAEGDASGASYTVVLTSQPAGDVTITISGHSGTDLSISGTTLSGDDELTFTTENWGTAQTVKVEAAEDGDATTDPDVTLVHEISSADDSAYDALANQSVTVSITENDADGVTIAPTTLTVAEGDASGASYTVVLTSQPAGDVTITISGHSGTDLSISGTTLSGDDELTFTTENWGTAQTVTVKAAEDDDAVTDADVTLAHAISSTDDSVYNALANQSVTVSITENDADGVTISPTTLTVAEGDASGASYTVVLTSQPAGDVTITISGHSGTDLSISGTTLSGDDDLTFTTENWGTAQTVKVEAAEDGDAVTDADVTLAHAISSTDDSVYNALANQSVTVSITENDADGVTISPTTLTVAEGDASGASYTVVLTSQPAGDVTITISGHSGTDLSISGTTLSGDDELTFTTENWGTAQTVKVEAAEDGDATTDPDVTLAHEISSADDSAYDALANQSVTVSITENDADGVTIAPTTLTVAEGDASGASYTVVLTSQPAGDVTITISGHSGTDLSISGTTLSGDDELTFTTENWGTAQTVKVEAAEDGDATTDPDVTLVHEISSADDSAYDALANQSVTVSITENDADGVTIAPTTLTVAEGDASGASYTVVLTSQPAGDVTITISGHSGTDLSISGTTLSGDDELTFTTENWGTAQTVTVKAAEDGDATTDPDVTLVHEISSADDSAYDALANQSVTVSITENDAVGVTINPTTLTVAEGDAAGASYTVVLASQPAGDVTIAISGHADTDLTVSGTTLTNNELTFTTENWGTAQTVTVKAAEDGDATTDPDVTLVHEISSADDSAYDALANQSVTVSITENHGPTVTVSFEKEVHYTIEGASGVAGVEVLLSAPLQTEVTIPITVLSQSTAAPEDYVVSDSAGYASDPGLTFSPGETFGYVFIRAVLDTIDEETETVVLGFGTLPAGVSEGSPNRSTVEVSDAIQVSFADSSYMVQEGGPGVEVMVRLNKPRNNLRVPLTANGQGGADDSDFTGVPPEVVFKDGETEKTFTFVAMEDSEEENGEMVRLGFGAFSEGMVAIFPDSAMVMIDEPAGVPDSAMVMIDDAGAPAPRHFAASWPTQTSITLTWFTVETAAEYKLEYRKQGESQWTRISGDFDHLPSTSDHRDAFGVAAGLECGTPYEFQVRARGSGDTRNDGNRYPPNLFGSAETTSARTGECAQVEEVTNLLASTEPACSTLTWTPPSGERDTGYRVQRYYYSDNRSQTSEWETLTEQPNRIDTQFRDCSDTYKTEGAEHVYIVSPLDDEEEFGSAYTSLLRYGPSWEPEGPLNVRLTHDTRSSRGLAWDAPRDPWLTTVKTARAGTGPQRVTLDPWVTGYRVERREYRRTEGGGWVLHGDWESLRDETDGDTGTSFTDSEDKGDKQYVYRVWAYNDWGHSRYTFRGDWAFNGGDPGGDPEQAVPISPPPPQQQGAETPSNTPATGMPTISGTSQVDETLTALTNAIADEDGLDDVSYTYQWIAGGSDIDGATGSSYELTSSEQGQTIQVRVTFTDDADNEETLTSEATVAVAAAPNREATGAPTIGGTPQVGETLTADTAGITDADGLTNVSYEYQWLASGTDIDGATGSSYVLTSSEQGQTIQVRVTFTDDADNDESLTSTATETVLARPNRAAAGLPTISGTPQVDETLTADTSAISDEDGLTNVFWSYQWTAGGTDIEGATSSTYTLVFADQGKTIEVKVSFTDDADNAETLTSVATLAVAAAPNREATGKPTIGGTPQVGETLTADTANITDEDGLTKVSYRYQWNAGGSDISGATGSTHTLTYSEQGQTIQVRVTFTDDRDNAETLTSIATAEVAAAPEPLTVRLKVAAPATHDGSSEFTFEIEFSEEFGISYATLRDHAFNVTGGSVETAQRTDKPSNIPWLITVKPQGNGDVTIELPATTDCAAAGAICTGGGRKLSNSLSFTISGPGQ